MKIAICPGSFDPITFGHLDIIKRASKLFDKVIVLVIVNPEKHCSFSPEERAEMISKVITDIPNAVVDIYDGLLIDYFKAHNATVIVKGLRAMTDFEYEFQMALVNRQLCPNADTLFLTTSAEYMYLSSSVVRQVAKFNGDISQFVPKQILNTIIERLYKKDTEE
ncbi:MAG: pantetheine-phosphate adenylyltransferase [Oscillospiraceae bacterium]|nr:pantetheine-phosphate adenylyltransferase [Oscillospiraceae bacterium]